VLAEWLHHPNKIDRNEIGHRKIKGYQGGGKAGRKAGRKAVWGKREERDWDERPGQETSWAGAFVSKEWH
jgi:hypothetical protein